MIFTMDDWYALDGERRFQVKEWADRYIDATWCFGFELAMDGSAIAARFKIYDRDKEPTPYVPWHTEDVFGVDPCPWPFR